MAEQRAGLPILAFSDRPELERWLELQSPSATGAWLKLAKKSAPSPSVTKAEAIDAALCFGWIDGQLNKYDADHWLVRFTPRKPRSKWSQVNKDRATMLIAAGRMRAEGLAQIEAAKADGRWEAAYAPAGKAQVPADLQAALDANPAAAAFFGTLSGANRYAVLYRIEAVKRAKTRSRKTAEFIAMLERGETIHG